MAREYTWDPPGRAGLRDGHSAAAIWGAVLTIFAMLANFAEKGRGVPVA